MTTKPARLAPKDRPLPFGRHEGCVIIEVPTEYLRYIISKGIRSHGTNWAAVAQAELEDRHDTAQRIAAGWRPPTTPTT